MADREKVLAGLEACADHTGALCRTCPYDFRKEGCISDMAEDALELLKEKPEQKHGHWIEYPKCLEYDGALDDTYIVCSACEHVFNVIDNCTELFDYCPNCGARMDEEVKQDDRT